MGCITSYLLLSSNLQVFRKIVQWLLLNECGRRCLLALKIWTSWLCEIFRSFCTYSLCISRKVIAFPVCSVSRRKCSFVLHKYSHAIRLLQLSLSFLTHSLMWGVEEGPRPCVCVHRGRGGICPTILWAQKGTRKPPFFPINVLPKDGEKMQKRNFHSSCFFFFSSLVPK